MFERYTERSRQVIVLAQDESRRYPGGHITAGHLLAGLLREEESLAARVLDGLGITLDDLRLDFGEALQVPDRSGEVPFTEDAKHTLELGLREALSLGHNYIGTEHILLAVARAHPETFEHLGSNAEAVRNGVIRALTGKGSQPPRTEEVVDALRALKAAKKASDDAYDGLRRAEVRLAEVVGVRRRDKDTGFDAEMQAERLLVDAALREAPPMQQERS